jgi:hypothetical protein
MKTYHIVFTFTEENRANTTYSVEVEAKDVHNAVMEATMDFIAEYAEVYKDEYYINVENICICSVQEITN